MSDTSAAIRAAREVNAETLSPDLFRQANEAFLKAKNEYRLKNFNLAEKYALRARKLAEQSEFESLQGGATRTSTAPAEDAPPPPPEPYDYPEPSGTPAVDLLQGGGQGGNGGNPPDQAPEQPKAPPAPGTP